VINGNSVSVQNGSILAASGSITAGAVNPHASVSLGPIDTSPESALTSYSSGNAAAAPDAGSVTINAGASLTAGTIYALG